MLRNIILGVGIFASLFAMLIFSGKISIGGDAAKVTGEVMLWGTLPETEMNSVIQNFNPQAKTYAVRYKYVPENEFNQRLLEALASGTGPDMIMTPYKIILSQAERIYAIPPTSLSEKAFRDTYVDGASVLFSQEGALALPVSVDPMVLFYNRTLFSKHGIVSPPAYWDELSSMVPSLNIRENGKFYESAVALGTPSTPYAKDIIMTIVNQLGQSPVVMIPGQLNGSYYNVSVNTPVVEGSNVFPLASANRFFTQFGDPGLTTYSWGQAQGDAVDAFMSEKLAMYIGYAGELPTLRARNPRAAIEMSYLPQVRGYNTFTTGMKMYAIATLKSTKNVQASFTVEGLFSGMGVAPTLAGLTGGVPALRAYAATPGLDAVVARSMLVAVGWLDRYDKESTIYASTMISDIINYRYGINDASQIFVGRLRDLYSNK